MKKYELTPRSAVPDLIDVQVDTEDNLLKLDADLLCHFKVIFDAYASMSRLLAAGNRDQLRSLELETIAEMQTWHQRKQGAAMSRKVCGYERDERIMSLRADYVMRILYRQSSQRLVVIERPQTWFMSGDRVYVRDAVSLDWCLGTVRNQPYLSDGKVEVEFDELDSRSAPRLATIESYQSASIWAEHEYSPLIDSRFRETTSPFVCPP